MFSGRKKHSKASETETDDFGESFADEPAADAENWDVDNDDFDGQTAPVRQSKSSLLPWVALGLVGAAGAGYFYYTNILPQSAESPTADVIAADPAAAPLDMSSAPVATPADATTAVPAADMNSAEAMGTGATPALPTAAPDVDATTTDDMSATPLEPAQDISVPTSLEEQPPSTADSVVDAALSAPTPTGLDSALPSAVDSVTADPMQPTPEVVTNSDMTAPQPTNTPPITTTAGSAPAPVAAATDDLAGRIAVLEHQVQDLLRAVDQSLSKSGTAADLVELKTQMAALEAQFKSVQASSGGARAKAPEPAAAPVSVAEKPAPAKPTPTSNPAWVLRAAQAGEAWVSRGPQGQLQNIKVGDQLPGLGRVNAITQKDGTWTVVGSRGTLRQ